MKPMFTMVLIFTFQPNQDIIWYIYIYYYCVSLCLKYVNFIENANKDSVNGDYRANTKV